MTNNLIHSDLFLTADERDLMEGLGLLDNYTDTMDALKAQEADADAQVQDLTAIGASRPRRRVEPEDVVAAVAAFQAGDSTLSGELFYDMAPFFGDLLKSIDYDRREDAVSHLNEAFVHALKVTNLSASNPAGYFYTTLKNYVIKAVRNDLSMATVSEKTLRDYRGLKDRFTEEDDQTHEWLARAYEAIKAGESGQEQLSADTLLKVHELVQAENVRLSTHPIGTVDDEGNDLGFSDVLDDTDSYATSDTRDLVRNHLLPLLEEDQRLIVIVTYGFTDLVSDSLDKVLVEKGVDLTDGRNLPLSSRVVAEVLGANGLGLPKMGYKTVQRRLTAALATLRAYLEEDERRENA